VTKNIVPKTSNQQPKLIWINIEKIIYDVHLMIKQ